MTETERQLRAQVRFQVATFAPPDVLDEIVDLCFHAAEQAVEKVRQVARSASSEEVCVTVLTPAYSILAYLTAEKLALLKAAAEVAGMPVLERTVELGQRAAGAAA